MSLDEDWDDPWGPQPHQPDAPGIPGNPGGTGGPIENRLPEGSGGFGETGGGGGGGGYGNMSHLGGRPDFNFRPVPGFVAPRFRRPTFEEAQNEPGYQMRLAGGADAMERSAAARGALRTGGTLRDLQEWGQNFAAQEYNNVFQRELGVFDREYRGAHDEYAPRLAEWQTLSDAEMRGALAQYAREWDMYMFQNRRTGGGGGGGGIPAPPDFDSIPSGPYGDDNWYKDTWPGWDERGGRPGA